MYNNNNINFINYNIKVNKIKNLLKEKIIEGDLNFNDKKTIMVKFQTIQSIKKIEINRQNPQYQFQKIINQHIYAKFK